MTYRDDGSNEVSDDGGQRSSPTQNIPLPDDSKSGVLTIF